MEKLKENGSGRVQGTRRTQNSSKDSGATKGDGARLGFCVTPAAEGRWLGKTDRVGP